MKRLATVFAARFVLFCVDTFILSFYLRARKIEILDIRFDSDYPLVLGLPFLIICWGEHTRLLLFLNRRHKAGYPTPTLTGI